MAKTRPPARLSARARGSHPARLKLGLAVLAVLVLLVGWERYRAWHFDMPAHLESARHELRAGHWDAAQAEIEACLERQPKNVQALNLLVDCAVRRQDRELQLYALRQLAEANPPDLVAVLAKQGTLAMQLGYAREAENALGRALELRRDDVQANRSMCLQLGVEGRAWECGQFVRELIRQGAYGPPQLLLAASSDNFFIRNPELLAAMRKAAPDDPLPLLADARTAIIDNRDEAALPMLQKVVAHDPKLGEAQGRLGGVLLRLGRTAEFAKWQQNLPRDVQPHPEIWVEQGLAAAANGEKKVAVRAFWEAVKLDANDRVGNLQLGQLLTELGRPKDAAPFQDRAARLARLTVPLVTLQNSSDPRLIQAVAEELESLGRPWEAGGWASVELRARRETKWARDLLVRLEPELNNQPPLTLTSHNPALKIDLSEYPLPVAGSSKSAEPVAPSTAKQKLTVRFTNDAAAAGINFQYYNDANPKNGDRIFEFTGGGIGVIDYDRSGLPDLFLSQGCPWPPPTSEKLLPSERSKWTSALYRNRGDGTFTNVAALAGIASIDYSQGVAVGDYDNDGFPDLYVGNLGPNGFYHNNGDGTFSDVASETDTAGDEWTTSSVLADFNGDGFPDLFVVNYLADRQAITAICQENGRRRQCLPQHYAAEQDRLYLNLGDGHFADVSSTAGILAADGKGLGVLAADFDGSGRLGLFVANDTTANFYFANQTPQRGAPPLFQEQGVAVGLALSAEGRTQACMGIAADDFNGDGLLDLAVTNFYHEGSTFYLQRAAGFFSDKTRSSGLREPTYDQLGFGAQAIDADLDGLPDLVVANGHVSDLHSQGTPYEMPAQYFQNTGGGRFRLATTAEVGPYFQERHLGRALARLDWNGDELDDVAVMNLDAPVALLTNCTENPGNWLEFDLIGTQSSREPIGATVEVEAAGHRLSKQLTAGDGYQASNQRLLRFGLGTARQASTVRVRWPSGAVTEVHDLKSGRQTLIEPAR